jgi:hypothetical protein
MEWETSLHSILLLLKKNGGRRGVGRGGMGRGEGKGSGDVQDDVSNRFEFECDQSNGRINVRIFHSSTSDHFLSLSQHLIHFNHDIVKE